MTEKKRDTYIAESIIPPKENGDSPPPFLYVLTLIILYLAFQLFQDSRIAVWIVVLFVFFLVSGYGYYEIWPLVRRRR